MPWASHEYDVILYKGYEHLKVWASTGILTNECAWVRDSMLGSHRFQCFFFFFKITQLKFTFIYFLLKLASKYFFDVK